MLVSAKEMLEKAKAGHYAVGQFNINNLEWTQMIEFCLQFLDQWAVQTECKLSPVQAKEQMLQHFQIGRAHV